MIDDTNENTEEEVIAPDTTPDAPPANLSITDLANIKQIIDVAASRGAFKTNEFQVIGTTCDRLNSFLAAMTPPAEETTTDDEEDGTDDTTAEKPSEE
jgi:hypothetical protein